MLERKIEAPIVEISTGGSGPVAQGEIDDEIEDRAQQRHAENRDQERDPIGPAESTANTTIR